MRWLGLVAMLALPLGCAQKSVRCESSLRPINAAPAAALYGKRPLPGATQSSP